MRKLMTWALALMLLATGVLPCAQAEQGYIAYDYTPTLIARIEMSAQEWFSDAEYRALATILVVYDMMGTVGAGNEHTPDLIRTSFVGLDGENLMFYLRAEKQDLLVRYTPADGTGDYTVFQPLDDETAATAMENICPDGSYINDIITMYSVIQYLREQVNPSGEQAG